MKILISGLDSGGIGGSETFLTQLGKRLKNTGYLVVKNSKFDQSLDLLKRKVYSTPIRMDIVGGWKGFVKFFVFFAPSLFWNVQILKKFKNGGGKILFLTGTTDKILFSFIAYSLGLKVYWIEYASPLPVLIRNFSIPKVLYKIASFWVSKVIVPTNYAKKRIIREKLISTRKLVVIPVGIESLKSQRTRKIKKGELKLGLISRLQKGKGQDTLIKASKLLKAKFNKLSLLLVGQGDFQKQLEDLTKELEMEESVTFFGYLEEKRKNRLISELDIFVFPTQWILEGFGVVLIEAMMLETPIVASNYGPIPEVVKGAAYLTKPTPEEIAKAVEKVATDRKLRKSLINKGKERAKQLNIDIVAKKYEELIYG